MSNSSNALGIREMKRDPNDLDRLREEWRVKADAAAHAEDTWARMKDGKQIVFDELVETLREQNPSMTVATAERMARTSDVYAKFLEKMHAARLAFRLAENEERDADRIYWETNNRHANERAEKRMTR